MSNYLISIITVNFNNSKGLELTIESVVNQTLFDFEYIVIDGGSSDESLDIIKRNENKISFWVSEKDFGVYHAMNKGIKVAKGKYLLFLNSGDHLFDNDIIRKSILDFHDEDIVYFNVEIAGNKTSKIVSYPDELRFSDFYKNGICHQSAFIKRELFEKYGLYDESLLIVSDWKFFILALFKYNCDYKKVNKTLSTYYLGGISTQTNNFKERDIVLNEYFKGYLKDYQEFFIQRDLVKTNRFRMLREIEKTYIGSKLVSLFFRVYIFLFLKAKLKDILDASMNRND